jgi:NitT/TauT family transport system substrate-binding protein
MNSRVAAGRLNGCVGWTPKTDEVIEASKGAAKTLVSNRNLLVIADVLAGEQGLCQGAPGDGEGPRARHPRRQSPIARQPGREHRRGRQGFQMERRGCTRRACARPPGERAGEPRVLRGHHRLRRFVRRHLPVFGAGLRQPCCATRPILRASRTRAFLDAVAKRSPFAEQKIAIAPIRTSSQAALEGDPLLSKDIRFFFEPNSSNLDRSAVQNQEYLQTIKRFLQVSPGSTVLLRGHVDNARVNEFRQSGGEQLVQSMALKAMELSRQRAMAVHDALLAKYPEIDKTRVEAVGRGWEEPTGATDAAQNRRVEVQWFTVE